MLTRRTNVLFDEEMYGQLKYLAGIKRVTVGEYIRGLANEKIRKSNRKKSKGETSLAKRIVAGWKYIKRRNEPIDYKEWINYGRRF